MSYPVVSRRRHALLRCVIKMLALFLFAVSGLSPSAHAAPPQGYSLVWSDNFTGTSLDTTKWGNNHPWHGGLAGVSVNNGLTMRAYTDSSGNHQGSEIDTSGKYMPTYGYFEAAIQFDIKSGTNGAFWMYSWDIQAGAPASSGVEYDIVEAISSHVQNAWHYNGYGPEHLSDGNQVPNSLALRSGYHTYGFRWTPTSTIYYVDGQVVWTGGNNPAISHAPEHIILTMSAMPPHLYGWAGEPPAGGYGPLGASTNAVMNVQYVKVYQADAPTITSPSSATGATGAAFTYQITGPYNETTYSATGLPAGLSLNTSTGLINGMPTATGTSNVTISATHAGGTVSAPLTITISNPSLAAPTGLVASPDLGRAALSWSASPGAAGYNVYRSLTSGTGYDLVASNVSGTTYTDTAARFGVANYYVVIAVSGGGQSANSNEVSVTPFSSANWIATAGGSQSWPVVSNWQNVSTFPNGEGFGAVINSNITGAQTISLGQPITLSSLSIGAANGGYPFTVGGNSLTFRNGGQGAVLTQLSTSKGDTVSAPITLAENLTINNKASAAILTISGGIVDSGSGKNVTLANNSGTVVLAGSNNFATGSTISLGGGSSVSGGILRLANSNALGSNAVTINAASGDSSWIAALELAGGITIGGNATLNLSGHNQGAGNTNADALRNVSGNNAFNGAIRIAAIGGAYQINSAEAGSTLALGGNITNFLNSTRALNIIGSGNTTISGVLAQAGGASSVINVVKQGAGTLTLSGSNTYSGTTTVSGGTLVITGALANGAVAVNNTATLAGTGTLGGATTVAAGGTLAPGVNGIGTLTMNNTLSLSGTTRMEISKSGATLTADKVSGVSTVTYGGTLTVTKVGSDALAAGNTFQIFSATTYSGSFAAINLPALSNGLVWSTSQLAINGSITVRALPVAVADAATTPEDTAATIAVLANDSDADGDALSIQSVTQGAHGAVSIAGGNVTYTPEANWIGNDSFSYTITDNKEGTAMATVTVTVASVNHTPVFTSSPISKPDATEGSAYAASLAGSATDADAGDTLTYSKVSGPAWLSVASNGALTGTPMLGAAGTNSFTVRVTDAAGASDNAVLTIQVTKPAGSGDADGDGFTNALEEATGANPYSSSSKPDPVYAGLQAWWKLDETSGTVAADTTGRAQNGTLVGAPAWVSGLSGNAVAFNGTSQSIQIPSLSLNTNTVTLSAWVKRNGAQTAWAGLVFDRGNSASGLGFGSGNQLRYHWNNASSTYNFSSGMTVPDNTWTFCAVVVEPTKATLYMQPAGGALQSITNNVSHATHLFSSNTYLGQDSQGGRFFKGDLDSTQIHSRALSASEIGQLANQYALPLPWANATVGTGALTGAAQHSNGKYTVSGSGVIGGTADQSHTAYQTLTGDGQIVARISSLQNTGTGAAVGVVVRDSLAAGAPHVFVGTDGAGTYKWSRRTTAGGTATVTPGSAGTPGSQWARIVRSGNTFTVSTSADGANWSVLGSASVTMAANCYIGLSVSSGSSTTQNTSQFGNVTVTP